MDNNKTEYQSIFKINGVPIMPPLMTKEKRIEMNKYKDLAIEIEKKIIKKNHLKLLDENRLENKACERRSLSKTNSPKDKGNGFFELTAEISKSTPTSPIKYTSTGNVVTDNNITNDNDYNKKTNNVYSSIIQKIPWKTKKNDLIVTTSTPILKCNSKNNNSNNTNVTKKRSLKLLKQSDTLIYDVISNTVIIPCEQLKNDKSLRDTSDCNALTSCNIQHQGIYKKRLFCSGKNNIINSDLKNNNSKNMNIRESKYRHDIFNSLRSTYRLRSKSSRGYTNSKFGSGGRYSDSAKRNLQNNTGIENMEAIKSIEFVTQETSNHFKRIMETNKLNINENEILKSPKKKIDLANSQIINLPSNSDDNPKTMILSNYQIKESEKENTDSNQTANSDLKSLDILSNSNVPPEIIIEPPTSDLSCSQVKDSINLKNNSSTVSSPILETSSLLRSNSFIIDSPSDALLQLMNKYQNKDFIENISDHKMNANNLRETYIGSQNKIYPDNCKLNQSKPEKIIKPINPVKLTQFIKKTKLSTSDQSIRIKPAKSPYNVKLSGNTKLIKKHRTATLRTSNLALKNKSKPSPKSSLTSVKSSKTKQCNINEIIHDFEEKHKIQLNELMERQKTEQLRMQEVFEEQQKNLVEKLLSCNEFISDDESAGNIKHTEKSPVKDYTENILTSNAPNQRREKAATIINAYLRGYLTRRLMNTKFVQSLRKQYNETLELVIELPTTEEDTDTEEDLYFKARILQQLKTLAYSLHAIFFELSIKERILFIRKDHEGAFNEHYKNM